MESILWDIFILLISFFVCFIMLELLNIANGPFYIPTISNYVMYFYVIFCFIGAVLFNLSHELYWDKRVYERQDILFFMWILVMLGSILMPLGMLLANWLWNCKENLYTSGFKFSKTDINKYVNSKLFLYVFLSVVMITVGVTLYYFALIDKIPIIEIFDGNTTKLMLQKYRSDATSGFPYKYYRYSLFKNFILNFLIIVSFFLRSDKKYKILFFALLPLGIFSSISLYEKAPIILLFLLLTLSYFYDQRFKFDFNILGMLIFSFVIIVGLYLVFASSSNIYNAIQGIISRTCMSQIICFFWYINYVEYFGYLGGLSLPNPANIFPFEHFSLAKEIMNFAFPAKRAMGIIGSMPTVFFAEFYINWGYIVAMISMIVFGFMTRTLDILFIKIQKYSSDVISMAVYVVLIEFFSHYILGGGILGIVFNERIVLMIIFSIIFYLCVHGGCNKNVN